MELIAGIAIGVAIAVIAAFAYFHFQWARRFRETDRERKLLINKAFTRDGQARVFPDQVVNEGLESETEKPAAPIRRVSQFRAGLQKTRDELAKNPTREPDPGDRLPENIKEQIAEAAKKAKTKAA